MKQLVFDFGEPTKLDFFAKICPTYTPEDMRYDFISRLGAVWVVDPTLIPQPISFNLRGK